MSKRSRLITGVGGAMTALGLVAVQTVGGFEGLRLAAYKDVVGVWTACYGETKGIKRGMRFSRDQCDNMLIGSIVEHEAGLRKCLVAPDTIPDKPYVVFVSWTYNVGVGAACGSTLVRKLNAGDLAGACRELSKWNKAGGKVVQGLVNRRAAEMKMCLAGLGQAPVAPVQPKPAPSVEPVVESPARAEGVPVALLVGLGLALAIGVGVVVLRRRRR